MIPIGTLIIALGACLSGCESTGGAAIGMRKEEIRKRFGEPIRIESGPGGRESWFYQTQSTETKTRLETSTGYEGPEYVSGYGYTDGGETRSAGKVWETVTSTEVRSIDFSPSGMVEAIPNGTIRKKG